MFYTFRIKTIIITKRLLYGKSLLIIHTLFFFWLFINDNLNRIWTHLFPFEKMTQKKPIYLNCLINSNKSPKHRIKNFHNTCAYYKWSVTVLFYNCFIVCTPSPMILKISIAWVKVLIVFQPHVCLFHAHITYWSIAPAPVAK
jgi:hypothetical protein